MPSSQPLSSSSASERQSHRPPSLAALSLTSAADSAPRSLRVSYVKEYLGVSVSPASVSLQSVVDGQQKLISEKEAEIAALKRRVEALERAAADNSANSSSSTLSATAAAVDSAGNTSRQTPAAESSKS